VALTATAFDSDACLLAGMGDFLSKPFGMGVLASALVRNLTVATAAASNTTGAFKAQAHQD
jgi:CheY-like chemotaxis protein